jgi:hypothetical protein
MRYQTVKRAILKLLSDGKGHTVEEMRQATGFIAVKNAVPRMRRQGLLAFQSTDPKLTAGRPGYKYFLNQDGKTALLKCDEEILDRTKRTVRSTLSRLCSSNGRKRPLRRSKEMYPVIKVTTGRTWDEWIGVLNQARSHADYSFMELSK